MIHFEKIYKHSWNANFYPNQLAQNPIITSLPPLSTLYSVILTSLVLLVI